MSSSSNNRALKRRPTRRQPLRRCRRFRGNPGGGPFLMDIHEPVLRHILEFTMLEDEENERKRCLALWKWTGQLGIVCQDFRRVARTVAPEKLSLSLLDARAVALLGTFLDAPWKRENLVELQCAAYNSMSDAGLIAFTRLFEAPASLPNLTTFSGGGMDSENTGIISADFLNNLARSCPLLTNLELDLSGTETFTPEELGIFGQRLQHPLNKCKLEGVWLEDAHVNAFLRHQGQSLTHFELYCCADSPLGIIARHCSQLERLAVLNPTMHVSGFSSLLQANVALRELNMLGCKRLTPEVIDGLNHHSPQLEIIHVFRCPWFTDDCLERLVQGQLDYWEGRRDSIPLFHIDARYTGVSRAGVDSVLAKHNVGNLEVKFLDSATHATVVLANHHRSES